jgi:Protein of unknown function (DUF2695)
MDTNRNIRPLFPDHGADLEYADPDYGDPDHGDPEYDERPPPLLLDEYQRAGLVAAVEAGMRRAGCDNTLRSAERWAAENGMRWPLLREQLEGNGGYCDCELLMNVPLGQSEPEPD